MDRKVLSEKLKSPAYRNAFVEAQVRNTVATQVRALRTRKGRNWTQQELGERASMKQNAIARLESPSYGDYNIRTLLRLAQAFDVGLIVRFAPFSDLVEWNQRVLDPILDPERL